MNTVPVLPFKNATSANTGPNAIDDGALKDAAKKLEATFLSEMLKAAGFDKYATGQTGGQDQFASFLRDAQAEEIVESGGIGLAESLYNAMREVAHG